LESFEKIIPERLVEIDTLDEVSHGLYFEPFEKPIVLASHKAIPIDLVAKNRFDQHAHLIRREMRDMRLYALPSNIRVDFGEEYLESLWISSYAFGEFARDFIHRLKGCRRPYVGLSE
jgi:hypothetical protein